MLTITIASIGGITLAVWLVDKILPFKVCPICAGVAGTWLWMLVSSFLGYEIDRVIVAMLLGGSVVGIAYQLEKRLPAGKSALLWKALFIPVGFVVAYSLVVSQWSMMAVSLGIAGTLAWMFLKGPRGNQPNDKAVSPELFESEDSSESERPGRRVAELKQKMENCC